MPIMKKNEIIIYQAEELTQHIEVRIDDETIWLTQLNIVLIQFVAHNFVFGLTKC